MRKYRKFMATVLLLCLLGIITAWVFHYHDAEDGLLHLNGRGYDGSFGFLPEDTLLAVGKKAPALLDSFRLLQDSGITIQIIGLNHNLEALAAAGVNRGLQRSRVLYRYLSAFLKPELLRTGHEANGDTACFRQGFPSELVKFRLYDKTGAIVH
ncbi:MAG: hypothetical protein KJS92_00335 [Bacteroidetes bacterium]|nr:hypothetical protein [Bacteroidota bacterium]